ncbi:MAG: hypothetical protein R3F65_23635 [bacterium]
MIIHSSGFYANASSDLGVSGEGGPITVLSLPIPPGAHSYAFRFGASGRLLLVAARVVLKGWTVRTTVWEGQTVSINNATVHALTPDVMPGERLEFIVQAPRFAGTIFGPGGVPEAEEPDRVAVTVGWRGARLVEPSPC